MAAATTTPSQRCFLDSVHVPAYSLSGHDARKTFNATQDGFPRALAIHRLYAAMLAHYGVIALSGPRFGSPETRMNSFEDNQAASCIHGSCRWQVEALFQEERPYRKSLPQMGFRYRTSPRSCVPSGEAHDSDSKCGSQHHSNHAARPAATGGSTIRHAVRMAAVPDSRPDATSGGSGPEGMRFIIGVNTYVKYLTL